MGRNTKSVREALGKEAWDILIEKTEDGSISAQHMKDISSALHPRVGGNHSRRVTEQKVTCDGSEMRAILSDWWDLELFNLNQEEALRKISHILSNPDVNLPSIASKLKPYSATGPLDTILRSMTEMLDNEPLLSEDDIQRIKETFQSIQDPESAASKTPKEAYKDINFYFKVIVKNFKSNNKNAHQIIEQVERESESSFQLPNVKKFALGEGTLNAKHLQEVKDSRLKLLIMQILENPDNKRRVSQVVSQYKKDISVFKELEENQAEKEATEDEKKQILSKLEKEQQEKKSLRAEKEAVEKNLKKAQEALQIQTAFEKKRKASSLFHNPMIEMTKVRKVGEEGGDGGNTGQGEGREEVEGNTSR